MAGSVAIGTLNFDAGLTAAPVAGVIITAASGATGVVYVVTVSSGAWGDNDAAGTITLGKCTGLFNDNENVTWTGGSCTVNHPDGSVGVDGRVKNGTFVHDNDPPNDWTVLTGATLTTESGGQVGNCAKVLADGTGNRACYQIWSTVVGKTYKFVGYIKDIETGVSGRFRIGIDIGQYQYYDTGIVTPDAWTAYTVTFTATTTATYILLLTITPSKALYFDEISLYEIREVQGIIGDGYFLYT